MRLFSGLLENLRRAVKLAWWLVNGLFIRMARTLLPYYQRYEPTHLRAVVPARLRRAVESRLFKHLKRVRGQATVEQAQAAVAAVARFNASLERRLSNIEDYQNQIAQYVTKRSARMSQTPDHPLIAVYTAICEDYDSVKLPDMPDARFDYVLFVNKPAPESGLWQVRPITYFQEDPTRAARFVKTHPHMLLPEYDLVIWVDANIMIVGDIHPLVEDFMASGKPLGAVPHPLRKSVFEEVEACIHRRKEDPDTLRAQAARYGIAGFAHEDLIESNLMMFNLQDNRVRPFLDTWWSEIDRYSKRDQLSLNYALMQHGLDWYRLTEHPDSVRNHPAFTLVRHESKGGLEDKLIEALQVPFIDPYAGPSYADMRDERIAAQRLRRIDIVVCVHNALNEVRLCLESLARARREHHRLIIVDDGSDAATALYLKDFAGVASWVELHRNDQARGYTKAANQGLAASTGELVILLNSDTIVTEDWAEKMADAVFSTPGAGIVGPLSNAASHQSIPAHLSSGGQTAINELPPGLTPEDMDRYCEQWTVTDVLPRVPLVHGFCFGVTRDALQKVGFFDEDSFPKGYGEENEYCFRAADAGFGLVIATHTFVFHAKSRSYSDPERLAFRKAGTEALGRLHGRARVWRAVRSMQENAILENMRQRARSLSSPAKPNSSLFARLLRKPYTRKGHMTLVSKRQRNTGGRMSI